MVCKKQTQVIKPIIDLSLFNYSIKSQWQSELGSGGFIGTILIDIYPKHTTVCHRKATQSQLNYAPAIWMFCRRTCNSQIEKIHQKTLRVINSCPSTKACILNIPNSILCIAVQMLFTLGGTLMWNNFPAVIKYSLLLGEVKSKIKNHENIDWGSLICKESVLL